MKKVTEIYTDDVPKKIVFDECGLYVKELDVSHLSLRQWRDLIRTVEEIFVTSYPGFKS